MTRFFNSDEVRIQLDANRCFAAVRSAMVDLSTISVAQPLRQIVPVAPGKVFASMPGLLKGSGLVGAKIVTAFPSLEDPRRSQHRGLVAGFDDETGVLLGVADAGQVTLIRTAVASAVATRELACPGFKTCAILGTGEQALSHVRIFSELFSITRFTIWGRNPGAVEGFIAQAGEVGAAIEGAATVADAVAEADVICTVTSASEPILKTEWVRPGTHINAIGSSFAGPREIDSPLVAASRFFADCRPYALVAAAEFLDAKEHGLVDDAHIVAEIGEVIAGTKPGRRYDEEITLYKSLGHVVQDLAALRCLLDG
ncbi:ornithine cyclodeaminase family protein [Sphingomonas sp. NFX23]|uniref:ornithine cyclodeaminase family protein n=1 Tax=Sphingomonas sp. NFX23 TaxID=2819532 RepID=UPI003CF256B9